MLQSALLAAAERALNAALRLDATALPRLERFAGRVIEVECAAPAWRLFIMADGEGVRLARHWQAGSDCRLRAPAGSLLRLATSRDKTAVLHGPDVVLDGDSQALLDLAGVLQDLELDWEHELARVLGPLAGGLLGGALRSQRGWVAESAATLHRDLTDYLNEEARLLVGRAEAEARFAELDELKLALDRLEARLARLAHQPTPRPTEE